MRFVNLPDMQKESRPKRRLFKKNDKKVRKKGNSAAIMSEFAEPMRFMLFPPHVTMLRCQNA